MKTEIQKEPNQTKQTSLRSSRRNFFKISLGFFSLGTMLSFFGALSSRILQGAGISKMASEEGPLAKAFGYRKDAKKVDIKKFPKRVGAEGAKQFCHNCSFFTSIDAKQGSCTILASEGLVSPQGWCNSWAKKG